MFQSNIDTAPLKETVSDAFRKWFILDRFKSIFSSSLIRTRITFLHHLTFGTQSINQFNWRISFEHKEHIICSRAPNSIWYALCRGQKSCASGQYAPFGKNHFKGMRQLAIFFWKLRDGMGYRCQRRTSIADGCKRLEDQLGDF